MLVYIKEDFCCISLMKDGRNTPCTIHICINLRTNVSKAFLYKMFDPSLT